jgi:drug/metabolite transporter (DMT)-like permease
MQPLGKRAAHALLHFTVFLWGFTAILGKSISLSALTLVWYRVALVVVMVGAALLLRPGSFHAPKAKLLRWAGVGALVAIHWLCFYGCIKYAGIGVAVICLSTMTFFTALLEPWAFRRALVTHELVIGLAAVIGVALLVRFEARSDVLGLGLGLASSFFAAAFGTVNGRFASDDAPVQVTFYELLAATVLTSVALLFVPGQWVAPWQLSPADAVALTCLSFFCTVLPWLWSLKVLRRLSPYTVALAVCLEPVYSLVLAYFWFPGTEQLSARFYLGAASLVGLVLLNAYLKREPHGTVSAPSST